MRDRRLRGTADNKKARNPAWGLRASPSPPPHRNEYDREHPFVFEGPYKRAKGGVYCARAGPLPVDRTLGVLTTHYCPNVLVQAPNCLCRRYIRATFLTWEFLMFPSLMISSFVVLIRL